LQISPAAVSGAVRYLSSAGLVRREREPGKRVDHFVLGDDFWYESMFNRSEFFDTMAGSLDDGIEAVGRSSEAGRRLEETRDFFAYLLEEMPQMFERWRASRR
ncbi:MAG: GbsR/MarR family transcriptional regulator, partial [Nocardioidaceae bacterium]